MIKKLFLISSLVLVAEIIIPFFCFNRKPIIRNDTFIYKNLLSNNHTISLINQSFRGQVNTTFQVVPFIKNIFRKEIPIILYNSIINNKFQWDALSLQSKGFIFLEEALCLNIGYVNNFVVANERDVGGMITDIPLSHMKYKAKTIIKKMKVSDVSKDKCFYSADYTILEETLTVFLVYST